MVTTKKTYDVTVAYSDEDKAFVGRVKEFPSLSAHGESAQEALTEIAEVLSYTLEDLRKSGERVPEPTAVVEIDDA